MTDAAPVNAANTANASAAAWTFLDLTGRTPQHRAIQTHTPQANGPLIFELPPLPVGLYRVSCIFDAPDFDWERLWLPMHKFNNQGQRTGPWDFDFDRIEPLTPAWWLDINNRRVGLVACARPTPASLAKKRMTLGFCFHVAQPDKQPISQASPITLTLKPFNDNQGLLPLEIKIEHEPYDSLTPVAFTQTSPLASHHRASHHWQNAAAKASDLGPDVQAMTSRCIDIAVTSPTQAPMACALALGYLGFARNDARDAMLNMVRHFTSLEHWGNPAPAGYGHNADMGVAEILQSLALAYHWFLPELKDVNLDQLLLDKLQLQMSRFFDNTLCWADYWGGSLAQDHGHRSLSCFGVAAMHLLDLLPNAQMYASFVVHRMNQALALILPDGGIPFSSYTKIHLYMDDMSIYRDVLLHATGQEVYDTPGIEQTISFVIARLDPTTSEVMSVNPRGDRINYYAGWGFLASMAQRNVPGALALVHKLIDVTAPKTNIPIKPVATLGWMLTHLPVTAKDDVARKLPQPPVWDLRPVQGQLSYRPTPDTCVCVQMPAKLPAIHHLHNPCDRIMAMPCEGHFVVHKMGRCLLQTGEGGYQMRSDLSNVLLIDGKGGWEDQNFAMGVPGITARDTALTAHRFDPTTGQGYLRLNLAALHDRNLGVVRYTRELFFYPTGMRCQDVITLTQPHELSWQFQAYTSRQFKQLAPECWSVTHEDASVTIKVAATSDLSATVHPTDIVWAYANENDDQPFHHLRFKTKEPQSQLACVFEVNW